MKKESNNLQNNNLIRSFGRIKSRKLSSQKNDLFHDLLPEYTINFKRKFNENTKKVLEIGFGFGDFLFEKAKQNQDKLFFGFEPHVNGAVNLLNKLSKFPINNIKISIQDVRTELDFFEDNFFDEVYILFPDPWPKFKHFKRRLITTDFLDNILSAKMKSNAKLTIATDHDSYKTWILSQILLSRKFFWQAESKKDWQNFPNDWIITKYQKKAQAENRTSIILNLLCQN
jgi:tRNA (guanine-N7-)-methyltransferase